MESDYVDIVLAGSKIKSTREALGLTQKQLSATSGVAYATLQLIEKGNANPTIGTLVSLAEALNLTPLSLFESKASVAERSDFKPDLLGAAELLSRFASAPLDIQMLVLAIVSRNVSHLRSTSKEFRRVAIEFLKSALAV